LTPPCLLFPFPFPSVWTVSVSQSLSGFPCFFCESLWRLNTQVVRSSLKALCGGSSGFLGSGRKGIGAGAGAGLLVGSALAGAGTLFSVEAGDFVFSTLRRRSMRFLVSLTWKSRSSGELIIFSRHIRANSGSPWYSRGKLAPKRSHVPVCSIDAGVASISFMVSSPLALF